VVGYVGTILACEYEVGDAETQCFAGRPPPFQGVKRPCSGRIRAVIARPSVDVVRDFEPTDCGRFLVRERSGPVSAAFKVRADGPVVAAENVARSRKVP
jgi:hypothetical protein